MIPPKRPSPRADRAARSGVDHAEAEPRTRFRARGPSPRVAIVSTTLLALTAAGAALAGPVKGRISGQEKLVPDVYAEAAKPEAHRYAWREPSPTVRGEFRALFANPSRDICIAAVESAAAPAHEPILIKITGGRTIPTTIAVSPGTRLAFENRDPFPHRLYQVGSPTWHAESIAPTARREWTATGAGRFEFRDELFPSVRSYVVVDPGVVDVAYPGHDGAFAYSALPSGDYVLKAFFQGRVVGRPVSVTVKGNVLVDLKEPLNVAEGAGQ
jgi:plastocyanin